MATKSRKGAKMSSSVEEAPALEEAIEAVQEEEAHELVPHQEVEPEPEEDPEAVKAELFDKTSLFVTLNFEPLTEGQGQRPIFLGFRHREGKPEINTSLTVADFGGVWPEPILAIFERVKVELYGEYTKKKTAQAEENQKLAEQKTKTAELIAKNAEANANKPAAPTKAAKVKDPGPQMSLFDEF
jgi:hypothetical protein